MQTDLTFIGLFMEASLIVQLVMILLITISITSWAFIFQRNAALKRAQTEMVAFEDKFWSGADLNKLYQELSARQSIDGMGTIFLRWI